MEVTVNNNKQFLEELSNIQSMVDQLNIDVNGIAIAVNLTVISKTEWGQTNLKENDNITIIKATQGG
ncbi:MAG: sulfur carrier protein ThiS [Flavobacteriales bacterium]|nr:sulfur carrier protein ThiS [Flavobacteriales bacterium]NQX99018.1 sulfur carrier protein ThiS [Flavobacteriales bacterium]